MRTTPSEPIPGDAPGRAVGVCAVEQQPIPVATITTVLEALADPMRLAIVRRLADEGPQTCGAFELPVHKSTLSHHFRVLREAGVLEHRCQGTWRLLTLRRAELDAVYPGLLDSVLGAPVGQPPGR